MRLKLQALRRIKLGSVTLEAGEPLALLSFDSDEKAKAFAGNLRWSAFQFVEQPAEVAAHVVPKVEEDKPPTLAETILEAGIGGLVHMGLTERQAVAIVERASAAHDAAGE